MRQKAANETQAEELRRNLLASFQRFTRVFFKLRTGRDFVIPNPPGRENHIDQICKALTRVMLGKTKRLVINVCPRYGKTELLIHWCAWVIAHYPDSNFIYVSYSHTLAKKQTQTIREILQMREFIELFGVKIKDDASAKDNFETEQGGRIYGVGSGGSVTGMGAGVQNSLCMRGAIVIDDIHKPAEATSETIRQSIIEWFYNTLQSRVNSPVTPIIYIGQCVHEDDLAAHLIRTNEWEVLKIPALDEANNPLNPQMHDYAALCLMREQNPYVYASQYQQDPISPDIGLFKADWFVLKDDEPVLVPGSGFIVCDTAETADNHNDATVFSFFALSEMWFREQKIDDLYGLHWIDCWEMRIEPKDLQSTFLDFWTRCRQHKVGVQLAAIERKSTGVTLCSTLKEIPGLRILDITRSGAKNSKANRFLESQPFVAQKRISLPSYGKHTKMCVDHMRKITASMSHRHDDIADTLSDGIKIALIDKAVINRAVINNDYQAIGRSFNQSLKQRDKIRNNAFKR